LQSCNGNSIQQLTPVVMGPGVRRDDDLMFFPEITPFHSKLKRQVRKPPDQFRRGR
jgi:hypothetical protein